VAQVLIVEEQGVAAERLVALIREAGHDCVCVPDWRAARDRATWASPDVVLLNAQLAQAEGLADGGMLEDSQVVLMAGLQHRETTLLALRMEASDQLLKPVQARHLGRVLSQLARPSQFRARLADAHATWRRTGAFGPLVGRSEAMESVLRQLTRVSGAPVPVLILGESGTGKALAARTLHVFSPRCEQPFVAVDCGALSPQLMEGQLFGHDGRTGDSQAGHLERAEGGTLFLGEISEMPVPLQLRLARAMETGAFTRMGSSRVRRMDVRVLASTNRDPARAAHAGLLHDDLYYQLDACPLSLPPLRDRHGDAVLLARHFLEQLGQHAATPKALGDEAALRISEHDWPGNVRQLRNAIERAWLLSDGPTLDEEWLPVRAARAERAEHLFAALPPAAAQPPTGAATEGVGLSLRDVERRHILATFAHCEGHRERAATLLGISTKTLYNRLRAYQAE
jgi:DNA-binding NtrC family response regulator